MYNYGILSTASIVPRFVEGIRSTKDGYVHAIASRTIEGAKQMADSLSIPTYYGSYEELYQDPKIDIIYIPTVNGLHYQNCKDALLAGKHVIVEKPFTISTTDTKELFELARKQNLFLMEAQKVVFLPTTNEIKRIMESNQLGQLKYIELKAGFPGRFTPDHWMHSLSMGGGALYGSATYTIEYLQYLFNTRFTSISGTNAKSISETDDVCTFHLKHQSILITSTIAMHVTLKNEAVFYFDEGYIEVPNYWKARGYSIVLNDGTHTFYPHPCVSEFMYEVEHIHTCLKNNLLQSPIMDESMTTTTVNLVDQLQNNWSN